jgi:hypothetical protein
MTSQILGRTADGRLTGLESFLEFWLGPRREEYGEPAETRGLTFANPTTW